MPRFIRGGRGLYRKIMSTNGINHSSNNNSEKPPKNNIVSTPRLNKVFKWLVILTAIILVGSFIVAMETQDNDQAYTACIIISSVCIVLLFLEFFFYVFIYKLIYFPEKHTDIEITTKTQSIDKIRSVRELFLSAENKQKINELVEKYYLPISNFAKQSHSCDSGYDYILWRNTGWSMASNVFYVLEGDNKNLIKIVVEDWGERKLEYSKYRGYYYTDTDSVNEEKLQFLAKSLKEKILSDNEWNDLESLPIALYFVIRNGLLKYFNSVYEKQYGYATVEKLCNALIHNLNDADGCRAKILYIYHYAYQNDIYAPLHALYKTLNEQIKKTCESIKYNSYEKKLYIEHKEPKPSTEQYTNDAKHFSDKKSIKPSNLVLHSAEQLDIETLLLNNLSPIEKIDRMTGTEFEGCIADLFKKRGYKTTLTPHSGDYGIDVIAENNIVKIGIQTKCYSEKVTNSAVQEAVTALRHYKLDKAMVITNNYFTPSAIVLARDNNVTLWDRDTLIKEISK